MMPHTFGVPCGKASFRIFSGFNSVMDFVVVIGQNFFVIFDSMYRVCQVNDQPFSNKDLRKMFFMLNEQTKSKIEKWTTAVSTLSQIRSLDL